MDWINNPIETDIEPYAGTCVVRICKTKSYCSGYTCLILYCTTNNPK